MKSIGRSFNQIVSENVLSQYSVMHKFGENPEIDTDSDPEDIWDYGGLYTFSATADITQVASSSIADTGPLTVIGLDENWEEVTQSITLTGRTPVVLSTPLIRLYRMYNIDSDVLVGDVYAAITGATFGSGVPDTASEVRGMIRIGNEQTLMCIYTIPSGCIGYMYSSYVAYGKSSSTGASMTMRMRPFGQTFKVKNKIAIIGSGTSLWTKPTIFPSAIPAKTDILIRCDDVEANNTNITAGFEILLKEIA